MSGYEIAAIIAASTLPILAIGALVLAALKRRGVEQCGEHADVIPVSQVAGQWTVIDKFIPPQGGSGTAPPKHEDPRQTVEARKPYGDHHR